MKRPILFSLVLGSLLLSACGQATIGNTDQGSSSSAASSAEAVSSATASGSSSIAAQARVIRIEASNWTFTPSIITAKVGERVTLELVGVSGNHGIGIPDLGIDVKLNAGETVTVDLPTEKAGTFPFRCNVMCGEGHREMTGSITITE